MSYPNGSATGIEGFTVLDDYSTYYLDTDNITNVSVYLYTLYTVLKLLIDYK